jgi:hypothetical protein
MHAQTRILPNHIPPPTGWRMAAKTPQRSEELQRTAASKAQQRTNCPQPQKQTPTKMAGVLYTNDCLLT